MVRAMSDKMLVWGGGATDNWVSPWLSHHSFSIQIQSYGLYVADARGEKFITTRPTCYYVSKHTVVYDIGE
jgi:hypothetical protein